MVKVVLLILTYQCVLFCGCGKCDSLRFYTESAVMETDSGMIRFTFFEKDAPEHVGNFKNLVGRGYYDGKPFHRVITDFVIQAGRDQSSSYSSLEPEIGRIHFKGALAAARMGDEINPARRSDGYEFYISLKPLPELDGKYTVFGRVAEGFDTVKRISGVGTDGTDRPFKDILINRTYLEKYFDAEKYGYFTRISESR
ncbi:MAG: peptidylprolyl isomerase [Candidatus Delongbacteria bacterium]|jgi:cyclophilin family peptidyl-prolyl cis-trans isomerase|nr:peptidylprolyl isomerase [Candidatus Delongbacteria bacterium]